MKSNKKFEFFDVTADIGFTAYGTNLNECFENAGMAMFNVISNTKDINPVKTIDFKIESEDYVSLLYDFLEELLFYHDTEFLLFSEFNVEITDDYSLKAEIKGENIDWSKHERGCEVKAITFHKMEVICEDDGSVKLSAILDL